MIPRYAVFDSSGTFALEAEDADHAIASASLLKGRAVCVREDNTVCVHLLGNEWHHLGNTIASPAIDELRRIMDEEDRTREVRFAHNQFRSLFRSL